MSTTKGVIICPVCGSRFTDNRAAEGSPLISECMACGSEWETATGDVLLSNKPLMQKPDIATVTTAGEATQIAIDWQQWASEHDLSYGVLLEWQDFFIKLADKFDLTAEFSENGII